MTISDLPKVLIHNVFSAHKYVSKVYWQTFPTKFNAGGIICDQLLMNPKVLIQFYQPKGVRLAALVPHHKSEAHSLGTPLSPK